VETHNMCFGCIHITNTTDWSPVVQIYRYWTVM